MPWRATVSVQRSDGGNIGLTLGEPAAKALAAAANSDPALSEVTATGMIIPAIFNGPRSPDVLITEMTVLADDPAGAIGRAWALVFHVLARMDGWDLNRPRVSAFPADSGGGP